MNKLVLFEKNNLVTTSEILAEGTKKTHKSILENIKEHEKFINEFGIIAIQSRKSKRGLPVNFYYLNEQQVLYLITLMRNNPKNNIINRFKADIIKEFFRMRKALLQAELNRKNEEWIQTRQKGKESRKEFTAAIKKLQIEHAKKYPDSNYTKKPNLLYSNYTRLINKALFDIQISAKNKREYMTKEQLSFLDVAEIKMQEIIEKCIDENKDAKETYKILEVEIQPYVEFIGKSTIIDLITNNQVDINNLLENE